MLGVYLQRSWVILNVTALILSLLYIFAAPILASIGQTAAISSAAGIFSIYMIPQIFAYAINFPTAKFLQSQSKIMVMAVISAVALVIHVPLTWFVIVKLQWGMPGLAVVLNASWCFIDMAQLVYIFSGTCGEAWSGFSWEAFHNLWSFVRLSLASAVMLWWVYITKPNLTWWFCFFYIVLIIFLLFWLISYYGSVWRFGILWQSYYLLDIWRMLKSL